MAKKQHKLEYSLEFNADLIGISSHENDYRLCWALNSSLNFNFIRTHNVEIKGNINGEDQNFIKYTYIDDDTSNTYQLISNRCDNGFLLEEYTNIDFILMINGEYPGHFIGHLINSIKSISIITLAFKIDAESIKKKSKLKLIF